MKKTATIAALTLGIAVLADIEGDYNTWLGYLAGESASGNRTTVQGAGAGGGAQDLYRTDLIGAASGVYGVRFYDTVGIGYRALRYSCDVSNTVAIGSHAFEGVSMGGITDATWINGHFVVNPPKYNGSWWQQTPGEFYITGDASKTNGLAPIWYDGTNLHLRGYSPCIQTNSVTPAVVPQGDNAYRAETYGTDTRWTDADGCVWEVLRPEDWTLNVTLEQGAGHTNYPAVTRSPFWDDGSYYDTGWVFEIDGNPESLHNADSDATVLTGHNYYYYIEDGADYFSDAYDVMYTFFRQLVTNYVGRVALTNDIPATLPESDPTVPSWAKAQNKPTYTAVEVGATDGEAVTNY